MRKRKGLSLKHDLDRCLLVATLYNTEIYKADRFKNIQLNSGGWKTNHTKNCINDLLPSGYRLYQRDFTWYVVTPCSELPFTDNMVLDRSKYE